MTEGETSEAIESMCSGCVYKRDDRCSLPWVEKCGQEERALDGICEEANFYSLEIKNFDISLVSVVKFKMITGKWAVQVEP